MSKNLGGRAFARPYSKDGKYEDSPSYPAQDGMSMRDYFAAKAMQGMISNPDCIGDRKQDIVREAYEFADTMLAERAK